MRRLLSVMLCSLFLLCVSAQANAVNIKIQEGFTANNIFGFQGVSQVTNYNTLTSILGDHTTLYDLHILGASSQFSNSIYYSENNRQAWGITDIQNHVDTSGLYKGNSPQATDISIAGLIVHSYSSYWNYQDGRWLTDAASYDLSYHHTPSMSQNWHGPGKLQLFMVTDEFVEINGQVYHQGSLIFCYDDGGYRHTDFNDLVFVLAAKAPAPAVPIPGAAFLFAPGLAGLAVLRKKMK